MISPWARDVGVPHLAVGEDLQARVLQLHPHQHGQRHADHRGEHREDQVEGADVLVVGGEQPPRHEAGRVVVASWPCGAGGRRPPRGLASRSPWNPSASFRSKLRCPAAARPLSGPPSRPCAPAPPAPSVAAGLRVFLLRFLDPALELRLRHRAHGDGHEPVVGPADLVALAVEGALAVRPEPGLQRPAGDGVLLHAERGDEEAVDHVLARGQHADVAADRDDEGLVHREPVQRLSLLRRDLFRLQRAAVEGEAALVRVGVVPVPLPALHVDRHVRFARPVLVVDQPEGRDGDDQQEQHRQHRPGDLQHGVVAGAGRRRIGRLPEAPHAVGQEEHHEDGDDDDDPQHRGVEVVDRVLHRAGAGLEPDAPGDGRPEGGGRLPRDAAGAAVVLRPSRGRRPEEGRHRQEAGQRRSRCPTEQPSDHARHPVFPDAPRACAEPPTVLVSPAVQAIGARRTIEARRGARQVSAGPRGRKPRRRVRAPASVSASSSATWSTMSDSMERMCRSPTT